MREFDYHRVSDVAAAVGAVAAETEAMFLGGGTNLVDHLKLGIVSPSRLVDVSRIGHDAISTLPDGGLSIGASVRNSELAADLRVRERYPALSRAILAGASGQLRNLATTAGNLCQRTRCVYFQDVTTPCNKRDAGRTVTGCPARSGYNRDLAILGHSPLCVATQPSDMSVALAIFDANVHATGPQGDRVIPFHEFHRLPGVTPERDNVLEHGELITEVSLPAAPAGYHSTYRKVRDRASYAFALVSVAALLQIEDGIVVEARIALGGVAARPWRANIAEARLRGAPAEVSAFRDAAEAELAEAQPLSDNTFKVELATRTITAVLRDLAAAAA